MFGLTKKTGEDGGDQPPKMRTPTQAIAQMMLGLTYDEMVTMAKGIQDLADADENQTLASVLNKWAKGARGYTTTSEIAEAAIRTEKLRPAPPPPTLSATPADKITPASPAPEATPLGVRAAAGGA